MAVSSRKHIESLDGWRGIAILLVFLFHYLPRNRHDPLSIVASLGWSGVDLFFVLSGFLITGILIETRDSSNFFRSFYARRALRIFPVYFLAVAVVIVGSGFLEGARHWIDVSFFVYGANIVLAIPGFSPVFPPYFDCRHFWSLSLEEQFYSIWPVVVFFVRKPSTLMRICVMGIATALILRVTLTICGASPVISYLELPTRMDSLLMGGVLALAVRMPGFEKWLKPARLNWVVVLSGLMIVAALSQTRTLNWISTPMTTIGYSLLATMYAGILGAALVPGTVANAIGRFAPLRFFGRYSYGLYVWHYLADPVAGNWLSYLRLHVHPNMVAEFAYTLSLLALYTGIAMASYHFFEMPFLRFKRKFAPQRRREIENAAPELSTAVAE